MFVSTCTDQGRKFGSLLLFLGGGGSTGMNLLLAFSEVLLQLFGSLQVLGTSGADTVFRAITMGLVCGGQGGG